MQRMQELSTVCKVIILSDAVSFFAIIVYYILIYLLFLVLLEVSLFFGGVGAEAGEKFDVGFLSGFSFQSLLTSWFVTVHLVQTYVPDCIMNPRDWGIINPTGGFFLFLFKPFHLESHG